METEPDPLELLRCPKGCDTRFINYLLFEGTNLRISQEWGGTFDLGLRCADCATHYGRKAVPADVKRKLDEMLLSQTDVIQDLVDHFDQDAIDSLEELGRHMKEKP